MLPRVIVVLELTSLFRKGFGAVMYLRLQTPPLCLGGLQRYHMSRGSGPPRHPGGVQHCHASLNTGPCLTAKEGSDTDTRHSAPDHTHLNGGLRC
jgi:hypothetical protein